MSITPHPGFRLIDATGIRDGVDLPEVGSKVEVGQDGAAGVISALARRVDDVFLIRDPAVTPSPLMLSGAGTGGVWLQTSGTTGPPKWVRHETRALLRNISAGREKARWLLSYHPGSFAGLQVILSAMAGGHDLVAPPVGSGIAELADWAVRHRVTHISGTPTFWRAFVMALPGALSLKAATLGGEACDQSLLDTLRTTFPDATLRHIYATTETGVVFSVTDGREGFPALWLTQDERLGVTDRGTLSVSGTDTGDVIEVDGERAVYRGRLDSMVNIGGVKVFPEVVEAHLLKHPFVHEARVTARPNPITGYMLVAEVIARTDSVDVEQAVKTHLAELPRPMRPASVRFVTELATTDAGKKARRP